MPLLQKFRGEAQKREYLIEIYARNKGLVKTARQLWNFHCACPNCTNSFLKDDGRTPYCEVHHITPFCEGGEDVLSNLSVLCAHHHRMAHFAVEKERLQLRAFLKQQTQAVLNQASL